MNTPKSVVYDVALSLNEKLFFKLSQIMFLTNDLFFDK